VTGRDDQFVRLLQWYPQSWRDVHGAVFVDTLREQSEHDGRTVPSRGETFAAMVNGLGTRLDARLAGTLALAGIALTAIVQIIIVTLAPAGIADPVQNGLLSAYLGAVAMLVLAGLAAIARTLGVLPAGRALAVLALGWAAMALFSGGTYAWAFGFQLAEDNQAMTGIATAAGPLLGGALALGLVTGWLCMDGVLSRTRLRRLPRALLSVPTGGALSVFGGYAVLMQSAWVSVAVGVVALSLRSLGAWPGPRPLAVEATTHRLVRPLAGVSAGIGVLGIVYAVTGAAWSPIAADGTVAVSQAILALLIGAMPLLVALGLLAVSRGDRRQHVGPAGSGGPCDRDDVLRVHGCPVFHEDRYCGPGRFVSSRARDRLVGHRKAQRFAARSLAGRGVDRLGVLRDPRRSTPSGRRVPDAVPGWGPRRPWRSAPLPSPHREHSGGGRLNRRVRRGQPASGGTSPVWCAAKESRSAHSAARTSADFPAP